MFQQALPNRITFEDFVKWIPEGGRYELHDEVIVEIYEPLGRHEEITGFLSSVLSFEYIRLKLPLFTPKVALVKL